GPIVRSGVESINAAVEPGILAPSPCNGSVRVPVQRSSGEFRAVHAHHRHFADQVHRGAVAMFCRRGRMKNDVQEAARLRGVPTRQIRQLRDTKTLRFIESSLVKWKEGLARVVDLR